MNSIMKKVLVFLVICTFLITVGCSSASTTATSNNTTASAAADSKVSAPAASGDQKASSGSDLKFPSDKKWKIGFASREIVNDFNRGIVAGAKETIEAAGGEMVVADAQSDPGKHNENIQNLINSGVNGLIIQLGDAQQLAPVVAKAKAANIPVVTCAVGATTEGALTEVGGDESLMAELMNRALLLSIGYKGDVYVIWVPGAPLLETRKRVLEAMVKDYPQVKLHEVPTEHSPAKVQSQMEDLLTAHPEKGSIAAVWAAYDLLGSGASEAIRRAGRDEIKMASIDGDKIAFQMLFQDKSPFIATVSQDPPGIGKLTAQAIIKAANGKASEIPLSTYASCYVATRHNGIAAGIKRWGPNFWTESKVDVNAVTSKYPQYDDILVVHPTAP